MGPFIPRLSLPKKDPANMSEDPRLGTYTRKSAEGYEDFLKALDVNLLLRKAATVSTPTMEVKKEGDVWSIKTSTTLKSMELKFEVGKEFEESTPDGREVTAIVTEEDGKFVSIQKAKKEGQASTKVVREFNGDKVTVTMNIIDKDVTCVQVFERV